MSQSEPEIGDVFLDRDARNEGRFLKVVARIDPRGPIPAFYTLQVGYGPKTTVIRGDRLAQTSLFTIVEGA